MRIGIDARKLHDFGIGTYIRNLLRQLARMDDRTEFVVFFIWQEPTPTDDIFLKSKGGGPGGLPGGPGR